MGVDQTSRASASILDAAARAVDAVGGGAALARSLGLHRTAPQAWLRRGVPANWVLEVERLTGVSRYELRPDVFGPDPNSISACCSAIPPRANVAGLA